MAGPFSGHLLDSYDKTMQRPTPGFGQPQSNIVTTGAMSFDGSMHGNFNPSNPHFDHSFSMHLSEDTAFKIATLQAKLNKKLGPEYISQRPGPSGGPKLTYAEGWKIINLANEVFGFNGWSSQIVNLTTDYIDCNEESKRCNVGVSCIVRVTLRCGVYHEDVGYGAAENSKSKAQAIDKSKKEAVTDALKRALRNFGSLLGNCLYDKSYTQEITKIKAPPVKFDKSELYRRPEFDDTKPNITSSTSEVAPTSVQTPRTPVVDVKVSAVPVKSELPEEAQAPITYIPRHLRQEMTAGVTATTPSRNEQALGSVRRTTNSVNTPIQTPVQQEVNENRGHYRQTEPSPVVRPEQRRVSFTEPAADSPPTVELELSISAFDETSYNIDSDDDAFYANVDLGDGDLGRPIHFEEGVSGMSVLDVSVDQGSAATLGHHQESSKPPQGNAVYNMASSRSVRDERTTSGGFAVPHSNAPRPQAGSSTSSRALYGLDNAAGVPAAPPVKRESVSSSTASSSDARRVTPSIGGFNFPPGMIQAAQQPKPTVPPSKWTTGGTCGLSNGMSLKRKVDTMQASSSSSSRQSLQGLGLAQQHHQGSGNLNRTPLANLDIGAINDTKRTKR